MYLDQNYASGIAKFLLGQPGHDHFGILYDVLRTLECVIPPSPFHVLELHTGYLQPTFQTIFAELSQGYWVKPWQEIVSLQRASSTLTPGDLLTKHSDWLRPAELAPLDQIHTLDLSGSSHKRMKQSLEAVAQILEIPTSEAGQLPFCQTLSTLLTFRSLNGERQPRQSDLADLLIASTVRPYVAILATDRFVREGLFRFNMGDGVYSGRRHEVLALAELLR